jgi:hypothetical protein
VTAIRGPDTAEPSGVIADRSPVSGQTGGDRRRQLQGAVERVEQALRRQWIKTTGGVADCRPAVTGAGRGIATPRCDPSGKRRRWKRRLVHMESARDDRAGDKVGKLASPRSFQSQIAVGVVGDQACARRQARAIEPAIRSGLDDRESVKIARGAGRVQRITADQPVDADCRRAETAGDCRSTARCIDEKSYLDRLRVPLRGEKGDRPRMR